MVLFAMIQILVQRSESTSIFCFCLLRYSQLFNILLRKPGYVPFWTCICSNVETILSWASQVSRVWVLNILRYFFFFFCLGVPRRDFCLDGIHHYISDWINNMKHMRISGIEPSSEILSQTNWLHKFQNKLKQKGIVNHCVINPQNYNFNWF